MYKDSSIISQRISRRQRSRLKTDPTQYIQNQEEVDFKIRQVLQLIRQIVCQYSIDFRQKFDRKCTLLMEWIQNIDYQHRSYSKVIVISGVCVGYASLKKGEYEDALNTIEDIIQQQIQSTYVPHLLTLCYIYKLTLLQVINKQQSNPKKIRKRQISNLQRIIKKIKFQNKYFDASSLLWETQLINQITIYLYQLGIQELTQVNQKKGKKYFQKGLSISINILGKNHKITNMLKNIQNIRTNVQQITQKKIQSTSTNSIKSFKVKQSRRNNFLKTSSNLYKLTQSKNHKEQSTSKSPTSFQKNQKIHHKFIEPFGSTNSSWMRRKYFPQNIQYYQYLNKVKTKGKETQAPEMNKLQAISSLYIKRKQSQGQSQKKNQFTDYKNLFPSKKKESNEQLIRKNGSIVPQKTIKYNPSKIQSLLQQKVEIKKQDTNFKQQTKLQSINVKIQKKEEQKPQNCQLI